MKLRLLQLTLQRQNDHDGSAGTTQVAIFYRWLTANVDLAPSSMCSWSAQAGNFRYQRPLAAPCGTSLTLSARASAGRRFLRLDPPDFFTGIFACQGNHNSSAESFMQKLNLYLQPFVLVFAAFDAVEVCTRTTTTTTKTEVHLANTLRRVVSPVFCKSFRQ